MPIPDGHIRVLGFGAVNGARTRDPQLGKLMLYQLSYYRVLDSAKIAFLRDFTKSKAIVTKISHGISA